jgi:predicted Zn-dependent protease
MVKRALGFLFLSLFLAPVHADKIDFGKLLERALKPPPQQDQQAMGSKPPQQQPASQPAAQPAPQPAQPDPGQLLVQALLSGKVSPEEETKIGRQIAGNLLGAAPLVNDAQLQAYVNRVGRWVALQSPRPDLAWHFGVIESNDINAFAAPGGYVLLTRGLYQTLSSEAELAGVLAHEIAHVMHRHHLKLMQQSSMIGALGGLLGAKMKTENQTIQNIIGNGAEIMARGLDKEAEFEADRDGVVLAARAGYDAFGLPEVLQRIGHGSKSDSRTALLYKTHPLPEDRLNRLADATGDRLDDVTGKSLSERFYRLR